MGNEKAARYVIYGAGAIGGALGAMLDRAGSRVICVARPAQAEALRRGLAIKQEGGEMTARLDAVTDVLDLAAESDDALVITTKSQDTEQAVEELAARYGSAS